MVPLRFFVVHEIEQVRWEPVNQSSKDQGPELQCLLKVKEDLT